MGWGSEPCRGGRACWTGHDLTPSPLLACLLACDHAWDGRAGYLAEKRREIEQGLSSGRLLGVVATNALELGAGSCACVDSMDAEETDRCDLANPDA